MQNILSLSAIRSGLLLLTIMVSIAGIRAQVPDQLIEEPQPSGEIPILTGKGAMFADIDTVNQVIYMMNGRDLWKYDLNEENWNLLRTYDQDKIDYLFDHPKEFGYDHQTNSLYFWSTGVGEVCRIDLENNSLKRVDRSFQHKNQFGHAPFFRDGMIHAFGGYGFWENKNLITRYDPELKEWSIISPAEGSPFPPHRVGSRGVYVSKNETFYVFSGDIILNRGQSDAKSERKLAKDVWKFDFKTMTWNYLLDLKYEDEWKMPKPVIQSEGSIGQSSTSSLAYSNHSGKWYIPVKKPVGAKTTIFLKTVDLEQLQEYELIELQAPVKEEMIATNFMFDQKSQEMILLGYRNVTNSEDHPMMVIKVPESDLLKQLEPINNNKPLIYGSLLVFGLLLTMGWLFVRYKESIPGVKGESKTGIPVDQLEEGLNKTERSLVHALLNCEYMPETSELEEMVWPEVDNYDYRRKLRNETIRSINEKTRERFGIEDDLIIRQRDQEDNRRYRYGVNEGLLG